MDGRQKRSCKKKNRLRRRWSEHTWDERTFHTCITATFLWVFLPSQFSLGFPLELLTIFLLECCGGSGDNDVDGTNSGSSCCIKLCWALCFLIVKQRGIFFVRFSSPLLGLVCTYGCVFGFGFGFVCVCLRVCTLRCCDLFLFLLQRN